MAPAALVTGSAKRIGREISLALAREGFDIVAHHNRSAGEAGSLAEEIRSLGRQCHLLPCPLDDMERVRTLMDRVFELAPETSVIVHNASIFEPCRFPETDEDLFERTLTINLKAPFFLSRDFARRRTTGHIITILDTKITAVPTAHLTYALSKQALASFTRLAAKALAPGIRVNGVCPGLILPPPDQPESYIEARTGRIPLRQRGKPEDVASAVVFLLRNPFVTGEFLFVDGGEHLG